MRALIKDGSTYAPTLVCVVALVSFYFLAETIHAQVNSSSVAVVVHPEAMITGVTTEQLRQIFLAERRFWDDPGRSRIVLLIPERGLYERDIILMQIYGMNEDQFASFWLAKIFRAEVPSGPRFFRRSDEIGELVSQNPSSIALVRLDGDLESQLRVLPVDGKRPGEDGYPLM